MTARRHKRNVTDVPNARVHLRALSSSWPRAVCRLLEAGESAVVRVLVAEVRGSAPRDAGTCMLVTGTETYGTIGGGHLEWEGMRTARILLAAEPPLCSVQVRRLVLGRELAQCCGGVVQLWVERFTRQDLPLLRRLARPVASASAVLTIAADTSVVRQLRPQGSSDSTTIRVTSTGDGLVTLLEPLEKRHPVLWLFGAGHVGYAMIHILGDLPFDVTWIDSRNELFPDTLPDNVLSTCSQTPVSTIDSAPAGALFLVMTHDHALDYDLCRRILERGSFRWLGLIGSKSKGARFRSRLARDGLAAEQIARLTCPIGIEGVASKLPAAIAVAVAAQLLRDVGVAAAADDPHLAHEDCSPQDCKTCTGRRPEGRRWDRP